MLKDILAQHPILRLPSPTGRFKLYTDWSSEGISAILHQVNDGEEAVISYKSRPCRGAEQKYASAEGELLAAVWGISKFRHYLANVQFDLITDSSALTGLHSTRNTSAKLARWAMYLGEMDFKIHHRSGKAHGNADGLSRGPYVPEEEEASDTALH